MDCDARRPLPVYQMFTSGNNALKNVDTLTVRYVHANAGGRRYPKTPIFAVGCKFAA